MISKLVHAVALAIGLAGVAVAAGAQREHAVTVYSRSAPGALDPRVLQQQITNPDYRRQVPGYAVVRTRAEMELEAGVGAVDFTDVAAGMDPSTVRFESRTDPKGTHVLEQDFLFDLVSTRRLLDRYLGSRITVEQLRGEQVDLTAGTLMAARGDDLLIALDDGGLVSLGGARRGIRFPELPGGLITRPTLRWRLQAERGGVHQVELSYETLGMTWWADYNAIYDEQQGCRLDLSAWVSLVNQSGASFDQARLKLVAGDVNRAARGQAFPQARGRVMADAAEGAGFQEQSFFEYHLYTLGRRVDLPDRSLKQLELFAPVSDVTCDKRLRFAAGVGPYFRADAPYTADQFPGGRRGPVSVSLAFENLAERGLGMPLPRGRVRVSQRDPTDGALEFVGEDNIDHTPRSERVELDLGTAFDVLGERRQADFSWSRAEQWLEETIEVELRNRKDEAVQVDVIEPLYRWSNWRIEAPSHEFERLDAATVRFRVPVEADATVLLRYTARYDWR